MKEPEKGKKIKILMLNTSAKGGGAAIAALRLREALHTSQKDFVEVKMLVKEELQETDFLETLSKTKGQRIFFKWAFLWERVCIYLLSRLDRLHLFDLSLANTGMDISTHPWVQEADILHIHWVNQGFLSTKGIQKLAQLGKPIVWTMHDMWSFSSLMHYRGDLLEEGLGENCQERGIFIPRYVRKRQWKRKENLFKEGQWTKVGCSKWITKLCSQSPLTKSLSITSIPNPINLELYSPRFRKEELRKKWGVQEKAKVILFGAVKAKDSRKGAKELLQIMEDFKENYASKYNDLELLIFGKEADIFKDKIPFPVKTLGFIAQEEDMIEVYALSDLFITPSLEDNLPNTIMEAMAMQLPVVGFHTGGIPEMITHKKTGYLARYRDIADFSFGIDYCLSITDENLGENARYKVQEEYAPSCVAKAYAGLYQSLLKIE